MGTWLTVEEASAHLGVSRRTVHTYLAQGLLMPLRRPKDRRVYVDAACVGTLRDQRATGYRDMRSELLELRAVVRRLRMEMDAVMLILDAHEEPLVLADGNAKALWDMIVSEEENTTWSVPELVHWADIFCRLREKDVFLMAQATSDASFGPFLRTCDKMITFACTHVRYKTNVDLQLAHKSLCEGRRRMRVALVCYAELYTAPGHGARATILDMSTPSLRDTMLRRVREKQAANGS